MTDTSVPAVPIDDTEHLALDDFAQKAYLDYAMYVILDRALPHIGDGLKPVQRRIVYAMSELGLKATAKPKKSARTVGDVLGKFHPHGDSACYEAMVHIAQPFSFRYPLVDGQGNWGSVDDPKSFAAMRYTEAKLASFADLLLGELGQGTVDWVPNFDGSLEEPSTLPARLPHVLINGASGIAVGMATDIPPHNLTEVAAGCIHLLEHPKATLSELMDIIPAPDFPTGATIISPADDIESIYRSGTGSLRLRAVWERENGDVIITALPHQVSSAKVLEQIAAQMQSKKLPMVADLRDESDHEEPTRLVIVPRSNRVDVDGLMSHLFATTDLEKSVRVNLNLIGTDGRPQVKPLPDLLREWIDFRKATVRRRLSHRLNKVIDRLHILEGLSIAYLNLDEVIAIIRAEDEPKPVLMSRFGLSDVQATAILDMRLRHLARIEEIQIRGEQEALAAERDKIEKLLNSAARLKTLIRKEITADAKTFGDDRRSIIQAGADARAMTQEDLMPVEPLTIILSQKGWVRAAKGHDIDPAGLAYKSGDRFLAAVLGRSNQPVVFLGSTGRSYSLAAHGLPSARGHGEPLSGRLQMPDGASVIGMVCEEANARWFLCSDAGYGFITRTAELVTKNRNGKAVLTLPPNALPMPPVAVADPANQRLAAVTSEGRLLIFPMDEMPELPRGKGNKIIGIPSGRARTRDELMVAVAVFGIGAQLVVHAGRRLLRLKPGNQEEFLGKRGQRGRKLPKGFRSVSGLETIEPRQQKLA